MLMMVITAMRIMMENAKNWQSAETGVLFK